MITVSVFGLGKLGLPLAALLAARGHKVLGYDHSSLVRTKLASKTYDFEEPELIATLLNAGENFQIVDSPEEAVLGSSVGFVIVPTPSLVNGRFSNQCVIDLFCKIGPAIKEKDSRFIVDLVSTVMPGDSETNLIPSLCESGGLNFPKDFGYTYNPEFIALGSVIKNMEYPDMQLLGTENDADGDVVAGILSTISLNGAPVSKMSIFEAEVVKISINNFVTMKISFINAIMQACLGYKNTRIDVISDAIGQDSRIGRKYLSGGAPYGGPCFPRDTRALAVFLDASGADSSLPRSTDIVNRSHGKFLADHILKRNLKNNPTILMVGVSYKENTVVTEESPTILIGEHLTNLGATVKYWNPINIPEFKSDSLYSGEDQLKIQMSEADITVLCRTLSDCTEQELKLIAGASNVINLWSLD